MNRFAPQRQTYLVPARTLEAFDEDPEEGGGAGGWTIPSELPPLPGWPSPGDGPGDYIPPGGVEDDPALPGIPPPPLGYTEADLERARREGYEDGKRAEQASIVKSTVITALVAGLVGYGLNRVLP